MSCCPEGSDRFLAEDGDYVPDGIVQVLSNGMSAYISGNETSKACILVFTDVYGLDAGRHKQFVDGLAEKGFYVVMPDIFRADPPFNETDSKEECFSRVLKKFKYSDLQDDIVNTIFPFCKGSGRQVGCLGFCYGAYLWALASEHVSFHACVGCHPSIVKISDATGDDWRSVMGRVKCPVMLLNASNDPPEQKPGGEIDNILSQNAEQPFELSTFAKCNHGWTVRGDLDDPDVNEGTNKAFDMTCKFFGKHIN